MTMDGQVKWKTAEEPPFNKGGACSRTGCCWHRRQHDALPHRTGSAGFKPLRVPCFSSGQQLGAHRARRRRLLNPRPEAAEGPPGRAGAPEGPTIHRRDLRPVADSEETTRGTSTAASRVMVHGATLTGKSWETTPDGRMGRDEYFVRKGHPVYVPDQVGRGRSGFNQPSSTTCARARRHRARFPSGCRFSNDRGEGRPVENNEGASVSSSL